MFLKIIQAIFIAITLFGCKADNDVMGPDTNNNGIRDDVDEYINKLAVTDEQKYGLSLYAKSIQIELASGAGNSTGDEKAIATTASAAHSCSVSKFDNVIQGIKWSDKVNSKSINTKARKKANNQFAQRLSGSVIPSPRDDGCNQFNL